MADEPRVVLIPRMPEDEAYDLIFRTNRGLAIQATDEEIQTLRSKGIPVIELYATTNEYAGDMLNKTSDQALAAIQSLQDTRLASLPRKERDKFGLA